MADGALYVPSPWQTLFHNACNPDGTQINEVLGAGAAGPGKTESLLHDPLFQVKVEHERQVNPDHPFYKTPGTSVGWALHIRREVKRLENTIARSHRIFPAIDAGARWNSQNTTWTFSSGYRLQFGHCKDPHDWIQYQGTEFTHIAFDELVEFEKEQYVQVCSRLRTTDKVLKHMLRVRSCSNPVMRRQSATDTASSDPYWVRKYFVKPAPEGKKIIRRPIRLRNGKVRYHTRLYLPATLYDNPDKDFVEEYEFNLRTKPTHIQKALLYGDWWVSPDSFFAEEWNKQLHVTAPFKIPRNWKRFRSMDWGFKQPGVILWWAMDPDGNLWCEREFTFRGMVDKEVGQRLLEYEKEMGLGNGYRSFLTGPADTQLWEQRGDSSKSKAQVFADMGIMWTPANKKSRYGNAQLVMKRLKDHHHGTTVPGLVFFDTCTQTITTLPAIQTDPKDLEVPLDGGEDHWYDAVAYAVAFASHGLEGIPDMADDDDWDGPAEAPAYDQWGYG